MSFMMIYIGIQESHLTLKNLTTDSTASASMKKQEGSYFDTSLIKLLVTIKEIKSIKPQMDLLVGLLKIFH